MTAESATRRCANGPTITPAKKRMTVAVASTSFAIRSAVSRFFVITDKHQRYCRLLQYFKAKTSQPVQRSCTISGAGLQFLPPVRRTYHRFSWSRHPQVLRPSSTSFFVTCFFFREKILVQTRHLQPPRSGRQAALFLFS